MPTARCCSTAGRKRQKTRGGDPRLCADGQPFPPAAHARDRRGRAADDAGGGAALCALLQRPAPAHRHAVGRALQVHPDPDRALSAGLHGLPRPQSGARRHGAATQGLRLVQPCATSLDSPTTGWSRRIPWSGVWATRLLRGKRLTPNWCVPGVAADAQKALTDATLHGWALGDADFVADLQKQTSRRISEARAGRPAMAPPDRR